MAALSSSRAWRTILDSIKSLEGFDEAWVEEAQSLTIRSMDILRPTIRKPGSRILFTWNPALATDPVDSLFKAGDPPPNSIVVPVNYYDNPFFPDVLRDEMEYDKARDPDKYAHVWLGEYLQNSSTRVFTNWRVEECSPPAGAVLRYGADFGFSIDPSTLIRCWTEGHNLYIDHEAWQLGCEIDKLPTLFMSVPEAEKWPLVADSARPETISYLRKHGFPRIQKAVKGARSLEEGVEFLKAYDIIVHPRCEHLIDELTLYQYKTDPMTGQVLPVLKDKDNHCIAEGVLVTCERGDVPIEEVTTEDRVLTRRGYRDVLFSGVTDVNRTILKVETTGGVVYCTPDHEIWTSRGFVKAEALRYNDEVITTRTTACTSHTTKKHIKCTKGNSTTGVAECSCTDKYGQTITERFLKGTTYTISMATNSITTLATLSVYRLKSMLKNTRATGKVCGLILKTYDLLLKPGTQVRKVVRSMQELVRWLIQISSRKLKRVISAVTTSRQENSGVLIGSAPRNVNQKLEGNPGLMMNNESALNVVQVSLSISTQTPELVAGRVLTVTEHGISDRVYDLTVDEHPEFFANGVLVHNCIDALRYALEGVRRAKANKPVRVAIPPKKASKWR